MRHLFALTTLTLALPVMAAPRYRVVVLDNVPNASDSIDLTANGKVLKYNNDCRNAGVIDDGAVQTPIGPDGSICPMGINDAGRAVGFRDGSLDGPDSDSPDPAFWANGTVTRLPTPTGMLDTYTLVASKIDDDGNIVGYGRVNSPGGNAFLAGAVWARGPNGFKGRVAGEVVTCHYDNFGHPSDPECAWSVSFLENINHGGLAVGSGYAPRVINQATGDETADQHAIVYDLAGGGISVMPSFVDAGQVAHTFGHGVNDSGQVVGHSMRFQPSCGDTGAVYCYQPMATLWTNGGAPQALGALPHPADWAPFSYAYAINNAGVVVGESQRSDETVSNERHGFVWTAADGMIDLNDAILPNDPQKANFVKIRAGNRINDDGAIAVSGTLTTGLYERPMLLVPVPKVQFTAASGSVGEGGSPFTVTLRLSSVSDVPVTVPIKVSGTAEKRSDYRVPSTITIPAHERTATFAVKPLQDRVHEGDEQAVLSLGVPTDAVRGAQVKFTLTIQDDD